MTNVKTKLELYVLECEEFPSFGREVRGLYSVEEAVHWLLKFKGCYGAAIGVVIDEDDYVIMMQGGNIPYLEYYPENVVELTKELVEKLERDYQLCTHG